MSDSVWPHRRQPTRLPRPWDSLGKNSGVGCHFLLQCMKVKSESEVVQSCPTLSDPMDYSPSVSSVHGIIQARVLEWVPLLYWNIKYYFFLRSEHFLSLCLTSPSLSSLSSFSFTLSAKTSRHRGHQDGSLLLSTPGDSLSQNSMWQVS